MHCFKVSMLTVTAMLMMHTAHAATSFYLSTNSRTPLFLKGSRDQEIRCEGGKGGSRLDFYLLEPGLTNKRGQVSFKSAGFDRYYITHFEDVYLDKFQNSRRFADAATFIRRQDHYNSGTASYESVLYRGRFLMCQFGKLVVDRPGRDGATKASFTTVTASTPGDNWEACSKSCGGGTQKSKATSCFFPFCPEPSTRPCNEHDCPADSPCKPNPCQNGGWCQKRGRGYICNCAAGYSGQNCQITPNPCKPNPCQNGGWCTRNGAKYTCSCPKGYSGKNCEITPSPCMPNPCENGGWCTRNGAKYACSCPKGYSGKNCETAPNPCKPNPCQNGGRCTRNGAKYTCSCPAGYSGKNCETVPNPCKPNPCQNGGWCTRNGAKYTCSCRTGYSGRNCEIAPNPCKPNPCQNGGWCTRNGAKYSCSCPEGYSGKNCETAPNPCKPNPCQNGGGCTRNGAKYTCSCKTGYSGKNCDTVDSVCKPNPCRNGGKCSERRGQEYVCNCINGYTGQQCQFSPNPCKPNPCMNGGDCSKNGNKYSCSCKSGYTGKNCETKTSGSGCKSSPCLNGGKCKNTPSGFTCKCKIGSHGKICDERLRPGQWSPCSRSCGGGTKYRGVSSCSSNDVTKCKREYQDCNMNKCPDVACPIYRYGTKAECCTKPARVTCARATERILGGLKSEEGEWPWSAALYYKPQNNLYYCGGVIVSQRWIVTAGHCVDPVEKVSDFLVVVGITKRIDFGSKHKKVDVEKKILHEGYDNPVNDIALLKLKTALTFNKVIQPICFPEGEIVDEDTICYASGWGVSRKEDISTKTPSDFLLHVGLRTLPLDACVQGFKGTGFEKGVTDKTICAGILGGGKDTCVGDSGGPLACQRKTSCEWYLAGVTSFGATECAIGSIPGGFVGVVHYESWIKQKMNSN